MKTTTSNLSPSSLYTKVKWLSADFIKHFLSIPCLSFIIAAGVLTSSLANGAPASTIRTNPITNLAECENGNPIALPAVQRPKVESVFLYRPEIEWTYSHHPHLAFFKGRFYVIWSNGRKSEDQPGQRVLISTAQDFTHWTPPRPLIDTVTDAKGFEKTLTASGLYPHGDTLVAYVQSCGPRKSENQTVEALTTSDGRNWSAPHDIGLSISPPNHGPEPVASGRLIISGNTSYPWSDDPSGLGGWHMTGINPPASIGRPCEGSFYQTDDGVIHMLLRNGNKQIPHRLWLAESRDNGLTWSAAVPTEFSDAGSKFHFGRLPDGRFYYVGNPLSHRTPLVLSLSQDGMHFNQHFILAEAHDGLPRDSEGWGVPAYPHSIVHDGCLYVIVSRGKNKIEVLRLALSELYNLEAYP
jgi:hypothetical protein